MNSTNSPKHHKHISQQPNTEAATRGVKHAEYMHKTSRKNKSISGMTTYLSLSLFKFISFGCEDGSGSSFRNLKQTVVLSTNVSESKVK